MQVYCPDHGYGRRVTVVEGRVIRTPIMVLFRVVSWVAKCEYIHLRGLLCSHFTAVKEFINSLNASYWVGHIGSISYNQGVKWKTNSSLFGLCGIYGCHWVKWSLSLVSSALLKKYWYGLVKLQKLGSNLRSLHVSDLKAHMKLTWFEAGGSNQVQLGLKPELGLAPQELKSFLISNFNIMETYT